MNELIRAMPTLAIMVMFIYAHLLNGNYVLFEIQLIESLIKKVEYINYKLAIYRSLLYLIFDSYRLVFLVNNSGGNGDKLM